MKKALIFVSILYTLGRYFYRKYNFLSEFNAVLAKDMGDLYRKLRFKVSLDFCKDNVEIIEKLH